MSTTITFKAKYNKNTGLIMNASELVENFLHGINLKDQDGNILSNNVIESKIKSAQDQFESYLDIKFTKQVVFEKRDFHRDEYREWGFIKTTYPINSLVDNLHGYVGTIKQIEYPKDWISLKTNSEEPITNRTLHLVPSGSGNLVFHGIVPQLGFLGYQTIPNYFEVKYCTGFSRIPHRLMEIIGMQAAISILNILGDIIIGAGITSKSLSLDGLSQSSSTSNGYSNRIKSYSEEIKNELPLLIQRYKGINCDVL